MHWSRSSSRYTLKVKIKLVLLRRCLGFRICYCLIGLDAVRFFSTWKSLGSRHGSRQKKNSHHTWWLALTNNWSCDWHRRFIIKLSFKVQARQWSCGTTVTCVCGVVLRDHNDVIEFNSCNDLLKLDYSNPTPMRVRIRSKKCLSPGISIKNIIPGANAQYEVSLPLLER